MPLQSLVRLIELAKYVFPIKRTANCISPGFETAVDKYLRTHTLTGGGKYAPPYLGTIAKSSKICSIERIANWQLPLRFSDLPPSLLPASSRKVILKCT